MRAAFLLLPRTATLTLRTCRPPTDDLQLVTPPPIWPPTTALLKLPVKPAYDVRMVSASSITLVTNRSHKVRPCSRSAVVGRASDDC